MYLFQFLYRPFLRGNIIFPWYLAETAVTGNDNPYGGMIVDHLSRADLRRLGKRNLF